MDRLEQRLGYVFRDRSLLVTALTHSSYANENKRASIRCNERLEFLGDALLGMVTAERLFRTFPQMPEGKMTRLRAELVCEQSLAAVAVNLGLGQFLRLGKGEEQNGGRTRPSILADAVEAVLAAVYSDGGMEPTAKVINTHILAQLENTPQLQSTDYKTGLQERAQRKGSVKLSYTITHESGPDHDKTFSAQVQLDGRIIGCGEGRTKKEAEQAAAKNALESAGETL